MAKNQKFSVALDSLDYLERKWRHWGYKNTSLLLASLVIFFFLAKTPFMAQLIDAAGGLGYAGAFIAGLFFVSTYTFAPASVVLFNLASALHPVEVALLAGCGAVLGDYLIFRFMKDKIFGELRPLFRKLGRPYIKVLFKSPYFSWLLPLFGAAIIASPVPDEAGVAMLGLSKIKRWQFLAMSLGLNAAGIFIIVSAARLI